MYSYCVKVMASFVLVTAVVGCGATPEAERVASNQTAVTRNAVTRESVTNAGMEGNGDSSHPFVSADAHFVVFQSAADNLATGDTNGTIDIFVRDRNSGAISRVSSTSAGAQGNSNSVNGSISADGRFVAFASFSSNFASGTNNCIAGPCLFVKDRTTGTLTQVDLSPTGGQPNGPSGNLQFGPQISANGRFVAFQSAATNLVANDTNGHTDIFVRDLVNGSTVLASVSGVAQGNGDSTDPSISADGRFVAFSSLADNLRGPGDGNGVSDVFVRDLVSGTTQAVSFTSTGQGGSTGDAASDSAKISGDGQHVVFRSFATNFGTPPDTNGVADTYVKDLGTLAPIRLSTSTAGAQGNAASDHQNAISFNGSLVAFVSAASNLVAGDTNGVEDVFIHDRTLNQTIRANVSNDGGQQANAGFPFLSSLSFNGSASSPGASLLGFDSLASTLVTPDNNHQADVFTASISP